MFIAIAQSIIICASLSGVQSSQEERLKEVSKLHEKQYDACETCEPDIRIRLSRSVLSFWEGLDKENYIRFLWQSCQLLQGSQDNKEMENGQLQFLWELYGKMFALAGEYDASLFEELVYIACANDPVPDEDEPLDVDELRIRKGRTELVLGAYIKLYEKFDPSWDVAPRPGNAPGGLVWPGDEKLTADREASKARFRWWQFQSSLRGNKKFIEDGIVFYLGILYSLEPRQDAELRLLLEKFNVDSAMESKILDEIK